MSDSAERMFPEYPAGAAGLPPVAEFRDQRISVQYALGGLAGIFGVGTVLLLKRAADDPIYFGLAGAVGLVSLVGLVVVYFRFGKPIVLRQMEDGLALVNRSQEYRLPFERLIGFTANWTDVFRNNVYSHTHVRFEFHAADAELNVMKYDASATYGTVKYEELQKFQLSISSIVADRMGQTLQAKGRVTWTSRLAFTPEGLQFTKSADAEPTVIQFSRISRWEVDQGLFKLACDGEKRPLFTEKTSQLNFYPGLLLFEHLKEAAATDDSRTAETGVLVG